MLNPTQAMGPRPEAPSEVPDNIVMPDAPENVDLAPHGRKRKAGIRDPYPYPVQIARQPQEAQREAAEDWIFLPRPGTISFFRLSEVSGPCAALMATISLVSEFSAMNTSVETHGADRSEGSEAQRCRTRRRRPASLQLPIFPSKTQIAFSIFRYFSAEGDAPDISRAQELDTALWL